MGLIHIVNVFQKHRYALGDGFNTFPSSNYDFSSDFMLCGTRTCIPVLNNNNLLNGGCRLWPFFSHISRSYTRTLFWSRSANVPPARRHLINLLMILCSWGYVFFPGDGTQTRDNESATASQSRDPSCGQCCFSFASTCFIWHQQAFCERGGNKYGVDNKGEKPGRREFRLRGYLNFLS